MPWCCLATASERMRVAAGKLLAMPNGMAIMDTKGLPQDSRVGGREGAKAVKMAPVVKATSAKVMTRGGLTCHGPRSLPVNTAAAAPAMATGQNHAVVNSGERWRMSCKIWTRYSVQIPKVAQPQTTAA